MEEIKPIMKPGPHPRGKVKKDWLQFRRRYLIENPPNFEGYYECRICGGAVHQSVVQLDHILNRSTHPHLRLDPSNIQTVHGRCNTQKKMTQIIIDNTDNRL